MDGLNWVANDNATWDGYNANNERIATIVGTWTGGYRGYFEYPANGYGPTGEYDTLEEAQAAVEQRIAAKAV